MQGPASVVHDDNAPGMIHVPFRLFQAIGSMPEDQEEDAAGPFAVISSWLQPPPRRERAFSCFQGSMDQLSSSEGLAPRRWPIHRARLAASASSLLQASEDRTPFQTGETATYQQVGSPA